MKTWSVVNRMRPGGVWLVSPDGEKVGAFPERYRWAAVQCAAAMNLTTASQRTSAAADAAGYKGETSAQALRKIP
jgi:hypothetical protein